MNEKRATEDDDEIDCGIDCDHVGDCEKCEGDDYDDSFVSPCMECNPPLGDESCLECEFYDCNAVDKPSDGTEAFIPIVAKPAGPEEGTRTMLRSASRWEDLKDGLMIKVFEAWAFWGRVILKVVEETYPEEVEEFGMIDVSVYPADEQEDYDYEEMERVFELTGIGIAIQRRLKEAGYKFVDMRDRKVED